MAAGVHCAYLVWLVCFLFACGDAPQTPKTPAPATELGTWVDLAGGGRAYFVAGKGEGKHPGLIVIQEWWGLNDWIKRDTERFASQGFDALAVDLYRGHVAHDPGEAHELMRGMPEDRALADLAASPPRT